MAVDIKKEATKLINEIKKDPTLLNDFTKDPVKFVEKKTGLDLPDEQINKIIDQVKGEASKLAGKVDAEKLEKAAGLLKGLLKK